jgi:hypothetical protein
MSQQISKPGGKSVSKKDACYHKVKSRYKVWPSAYASGALAKCRKVGAANWGNSKKKADGGVYDQKPKRAFKGAAIKGTAVARGCGCVMNGRRKRTKGAVTQS